MSVTMEERNRRSDSEAELKLRVWEALFIYLDLPGIQEAKQ